MRDLWVKRRILVGNAVAAGAAETRLRRRAECEVGELEAERQAVSHLLDPGHGDDDAGIGGIVFEIGIAIIDEGATGSKSGFLVRVGINEMTTFVPCCARKALISSAS